MTIAISGTTGITLDGQFNSASTFGFKNRLINSAMVIDQRNAGAAVTPSSTGGTYILDRWNTFNSQASKFTFQQNAGSVTPPVGFKNYFGATSLSAYTVGASESFSVRQFIEGYNASDLSFGTANASIVTLSFWVRSSLTGSFGGALHNGADRFYPFSYTISSANTWEQKTVTVTGDTSGTWSTTTGTGLAVQFSLGAGASVSGTAGAWTGSTALQPTGSTSVVGTNGATFYITGVQLEKGSTATSFDYRPYGTELVLCQRYYQKSYNTDVAPGTNTTVGTVTFREYSTNTFLPNFATRLNTPLRATPTVVNWYTTNGILNSVSVAAGSNTINTLYDYGMNSTGWMLINGSVSSGSQITAHYVVSAEL